MGTPSSAISAVFRVLCPMSIKKWRAGSMCRGGLRQALLGANARTCAGACAPLGCSSGYKLLKVYTVYQMYRI